MLRCGLASGWTQGRGFPWQMERLCVPLPLPPGAGAPSTPATTSCSHQLSPGFLFPALCCPHLPSDHHVCPYHDSLQPKELRTGLTPTGSVFMDVLKPPGSFPEQLIRSECCREQNRSSGSLWRKRMQEQTQSLVSALIGETQITFLLQVTSQKDWCVLAGQSEWGRVTFRLDLCPSWIGVSRDVCGLRGVYDLHLYTLHPLGCFPFFCPAAWDSLYVHPFCSTVSCEWRQMVKSELFCEPSGSGWHFPCQSPLMPFKAKAVGRHFCKYIVGHNLISSSGEESGRFGLSPGYVTYKP